MDKAVGSTNPLGNTNTNDIIVNPVLVVGYCDESLCGVRLLLTQARAVKEQQQQYQILTLHEESDVHGTNHEKESNDNSLKPAFPDYPPLFIYHINQVKSKNTNFYNIKSIIHLQLYSIFNQISSTIFIINQISSIHKPSHWIDRFPIW